MYLIERHASWPLAVFLCVFLVSGLQSKHVHNHDDLTVLVDYEKYQQFYRFIDSNKSEVCANSETEEYRKCDNKCVLGCRHASSSSGITLSKADCVNSECIDGCFCRDGLIRHQNKCIPASECPIRKNKAMEMMAESNNSNTTKHLMQMQTQIQNQTQLHDQHNQTQAADNQIVVNNPKIFGFPFFNRGCQNPFAPCSVPISVPVVQTFDQTVSKKDSKNAEHGRDRPYIPNESPVVVHIHSDGSVTGSTDTANNNNDDNNNNNNNNNNNPSGGSGVTGVGSDISSGIIGWDNGCARSPNGCGQQEYVEVDTDGGAGVDYSGYTGDYGVNGGFPNFGNPAFGNFPNFGGMDGFTGIGGFRDTTKTPTKKKVQNQAQNPTRNQTPNQSNSKLPNNIRNTPDVAGFSIPTVTHNSTEHTTTLNFGIYSLTYNPGGTRTLHIFGLGTYTFIADGTIISSNVGKKIHLPFEVKNVIVENNDNVENDENQYDSVDDDYEPEWHKNKYQTTKSPVKTQKKPAKKPQPVIDEDDEDAEKEIPEKQQLSKLPYQLQYPYILNPNVRPYSTNVGLETAPIQFIPFGYIPTPSSVDTVSKPSKKKQPENQTSISKKPAKESNKQQPIQKPLTEYEPITNPIINSKPSKMQLNKAKPSELGKLNPNNQPAQQVYLNYINSNSPQNVQNQPNSNSGNGFPHQHPSTNGQQNQFIPFNIPFNTQKPNGISIFPSFIPNQPVNNVAVTNAANNLPAQFGQKQLQLNQFNPFIPFIPQFNTQNTQNTIPNINIPNNLPIPNNLNIPNNADTLYTFPIINTVW